MRIYFVFVNDTATTEIYTLSLHDARPICAAQCRGSSTWPNIIVADERIPIRCAVVTTSTHAAAGSLPLVKTQRTSSSDRKSTRLNSSHANISYAVFCL